MSLAPERAASTPAEDPVNSTVTVTSGYFSMKLSARAFPNFSIEVEPDMEMDPDNSAPAASVVFSASAAVSFVVSAAVVGAAVVGAAVVSFVLLPHPAIIPAAMMAAPVNMIIFLVFIIIFLLLLSHFHFFFSSLMYTKFLPRIQSFKNHDPVTCL